MKKIILCGSTVLLCMTVTACATPLKSPCGPTAGLTDPCGNSKPINTPDATEQVTFAHPSSISSTADKQFPV